MTSSESIRSAGTRKTGFAALFGTDLDGNRIASIQIPMIQRDYAQGRQTTAVTRIRSQFIEAVCSALLPDCSPIELDFIYGDVDRDGKFIPLDGQQRLTFLFMLHCYLAWQVDVDIKSQPWSQFSYATRPGARDFCEFVGRCSPDLSEGRLSDWIKDQAGYFSTWDYDPTIQSMLVVLDSLHDWFQAQGDAFDFAAAWKELTHPEKPRIQFHLLSMEATGLTNELYIKMNSRGKPLTPFENFKAQFEETLKTVDPDRGRDFAQKIDTSWSDILWPYRGDDQVIDDEYMRYFRFVTEVSAWNSGVEVKVGSDSDPLGYLLDLANNVYGPGQEKARANLDFLFDAFDVWNGKDIACEFEALLTADRAKASDKLLMFNAFEKEGVDLVHACCRYYGNREWDLAHTLFLYGVLLGKKAKDQDPEEFSRRLRVLRNVIEASSGDEIRAGERNNMPGLLADVRRIVEGAVDQVDTFNQVQKQNELDKAALLKTVPGVASGLYQLEDHDLIRGGLVAFDLDPAHFQVRTRAFLRVFDKSAYSGDKPWVELTGALLAKGDYARKQSRWTGYDFLDLGAPKNEEPWRVLFRGKQRGVAVPALRQPLMALLDAMEQGETLTDMINAFTADQTIPKDWRYYLVKYSAMRVGASGRYVANDVRYEMCMLDKAQMNSRYADAYLVAAVEASGISRDAIANQNWPNDFTGWEDQPRWLELKDSGIRLRSVNDGWEIAGLSLACLQQVLLNTVNVATATPEEHVIQIPKKDGFDAIDRIVVAGELIRALVSNHPVDQAGCGVVPESA